MRICACDPGQHVGLAFRNEDGSYDTAMIYNNMGDTIDLIAAAKPSVIIVERFSTAGRISRAGLDTVECQGAIFGLAYVIKAKLYFHRPENRLAFMEQARSILKADKSKLASHEVDALAHLLTWEYMHKKELGIA